MQEVELVPGGKELVVTQENREEFVALFIEYEFKKQCAPQLKAFKKGFNRIIDLPVIKHVLNPGDLEQSICGQKQLDFHELKEYCIYANGFDPDC